MTTGIIIGIDLKSVVAGFAAKTLIDNKPKEN